MKNLLAALSETRIRVAIANGDFENLPGKGKPLAIENLYILPSELRGAYLVLKNSGYLEPGSSPESPSEAPLVHTETASLIKKHESMKNNPKKTPLKYRITIKFTS